jgi:16S rRNA (guanine966-N2)-methyltransferase
MISHSRFGEILVRVIAGKFRSRRLKGPGALALRPTSDRLRETLFNILGPAVEDSLFVDLYAGIGAIGIEAISRGARQTIFVESHPKAGRLIRENLATLKILSAFELIEADVLVGLRNIAGRHLLADFVFLDPPYERTEEPLRVLEFLDRSRLVAPQGLVIVEHRSGMKTPDRLNRLECTRQLEQGDATLSFYRLFAAA